MPGTGSGQNNDSFHWWTSWHFKRAVKNAWDSDTGAESAKLSIPLRDGLTGMHAVGGAHPTSLGLTSSGNSPVFCMDWMRNGKNEWGNKWREWCLRPCGEHSPMSTDKLLNFQTPTGSRKWSEHFQTKQECFPQSTVGRPPVNQVQKQRINSEKRQ